MPYSWHKAEEASQQEYQQKGACIPHYLEGFSSMRGQNFLGICENLFEHLISLVKVWSFSSFTELCKMALNAMNCHGTVIL